MSRDTLIDRAREALLRKIALKELMPGQWVNEIQLASELGISRTPVRSAIQTLIAYGLLRRGGNRRCYVIDPRPEDLCDMLEIREGIEAMAARIMADRGSTEAVQRLKIIADDLETTRRAGDVSNYRQKDFEFHRHLLSHCGNPQILQFTSAEPLVLATFICRAIHGVAPEPWSNPIPHDMIVEAVVKRDPEAAESATRSHLQRSRQHFEELIRWERMDESGIVL